MNHNAAWPIYSALLPSLITPIHCWQWRKHIPLVRYWIARAFREESKYNDGWWCLSLHIMMTSMHGNHFRITGFVQGICITFSSHKKVNNAELWSCSSVFCVELFWVMLIFSVFLAATKQLYEWISPSVCPAVRPSVRLSVTPFSLWSHHIIMKFWRVITNDRSDVHAKGQG